MAETKGAADGSSSFITASFRLATEAGMPKEKQPRPTYVISILIRSTDFSSH